MKNWKKITALFLSGQTISLFGSSLVQYAITWHITLTMQSGTYMTISIVCGILPMFLISFFAGVWADRYSRKRLIVLSDGFIAITTLILALLFLSDINYLWLLYVALAMRGIGTGIQMPAVNAVLPQFVPQESLTKVNAINRTIMSATMLVSPMLAAVLLNFAEIEAIFFIDVFTALLAILIMIFFIKIPKHKKAMEKQKGYFSDLKEGLQYIARHKFIKMFFIFNSIFFISVAPVAFLTSLQIVRTWGDEVWRLSAMETTFSLGMILGGLFISIWGGFKNKTYTMALANLVMGISGIALGFVPYFWLYLCFMGLGGASLSIFDTPASVLMQQKVDGDYLGRVFGVMSMLSSFLMPMSMLIYGPLADTVDVNLLISGGSAVILVLSVLFFKSKTLVEAGKP